MSAHRHRRPATRDTNRVSRNRREPRAGVAAWESRRLAFFIPARSGNHAASFGKGLWPGGSFSGIIRLFARKPGPKASGRFPIPATGVNRSPDESEPRLANHGGPGVAGRRDVKIPMYAIFENGSHQFRVQEGDVVRIDRHDGDPGTEVVFDKVLLLAGDGAPTIGAPHVEGARVVAKILQTYRAKKIIIQKFRRRKGYRKRRGHRQPFTNVQIVSVNAG